MERCWNWLSSAAPSIPRPLLVLLLVYCFSSQFLPIEPYIVPYLTSVKNFTNFQVAVDIFPISVYAQLVFTLLLAPACYYLSHKVVLSLGAFCMLLTYLIIWVGQSLPAMQIMQIIYGFGLSARLVSLPYIFLLVTEEEYQNMTSITNTLSLLSFMVASELSQLLVFRGAPYVAFFIISLSALGICGLTTFFFPKENSLNSLSSLTTFWAQSEGWHSILRETWSNRTLQILSLWWAIAFAGFSLVQNYGTTLFDAVDCKSNLNGHILAASQAVRSVGSYCAIHIEKFANKSGIFIYIFGSAVMGIICLSMGVFSNIWAAYLLYVTISGIYQTLDCLACVRCSRLLSNGQFILLFSVNNFTGLLLETLLQAAVEISGLSTFAQFMFFAGCFFLSAILFVGIYFFDSRGKLRPNMHLWSAESTAISDYTI